MIWTSKQRRVYQRPHSERARVGRRPVRAEASFLRWVGIVGLEHAARRRSRRDQGRAQIGDNYPLRHDFFTVALTLRRDG